MSSEQIFSIESSSTESSMNSPLEKKKKKNTECLGLHKSGLDNSQNIDGLLAHIRSTRCDYM